MSEENENTTPPWGDDFDAQRAWTTIQAQREEIKGLKGRDVLTDEQRQQLGEYQALREASQTDAERQAAQIEELTATAGQVPTLQSQNLRLQVALDKGMPATLAGRLQGSTREELEADADTLLGLVGTPQSGILRPIPSQGTSGGAGNGPSLDAQIEQARKSGNIGLAIRLETRKLQSN